MATEIKTYDPASVILSIGGHIVSGYESGSFIRLAREVENFTYTVGPDGKEGVRTKRNHRGGLLTLTLRQTAASNYVLSNLANRDEAGADGVVPISIADLNSPDTEFVSAKGWIQKPPDIEYGQEAQGRAWTLMLGEVPIIQAGTPSTAALQGTLT